jgi:hypothetical protein
MTSQSSENFNDVSTLKPVEPAIAILEIFKNLMSFRICYFAINGVEFPNVAPSALESLDAFNSWLMDNST